MNLMKLLIITLIFISTPVLAAGPLGGIEMDIAKIADNAEFEKVVRDQARAIEMAVNDMSYTIE